MTAALEGGEWSAARLGQFTPGKDPVPILQEAGWAPGPVWTGGKSRPHRDSIPYRPARPGPQRLHVLKIICDESQRAVSPHHDHTDWPHIRALCWELTIPPVSSVNSAVGLFHSLCGGGWGGRDSWNSFKILKRC